MTELIDWMTDLIDWTERYGYRVCVECHGLFPDTDIVVGVCLWCWEKGGDDDVAA